MTAAPTGHGRFCGHWPTFPGLQLICKPHNEGKGAALRTGFAAATGDVVVVQDADLEYDPRDFPQLLQPIIEGRADVVYGSRFLGDVPRDPSWLHRFGNGLLTRASNLLTGLRLTDMETCYKAFRRDVLRGIEIRQNRFGFEPEVTAKLARRGARVVEVPINYERTATRKARRSASRTHSMHSIALCVTDGRSIWADWTYMFDRPGSWVPSCGWSETTRAGRS